MSVTPRLESRAYDCIVIPYILQLLLLVCMGANVAQIFVHAVAHEAFARPYSYIRWGISFIAMIPLAILLLEIENPYEDAWPAIVGKMAVLAVALLTFGRIFWRRECRPPQQPLGESTCARKSS
jgi:hypothetical protein